MTARLILSFYALLFLVSGLAWLGFGLRWFDFILPVSLAVLLAVDSLILFKLFPGAVAWLRSGLVIITTLSILSVAIAIYPVYRQLVAKRNYAHSQALLTMARQFEGNAKIAKLNEAVVAANRAIAANPSVVANWFGRAEVYRAMVEAGVGEALARAQSDYQQVLKLAPGNPTALFNLAGFALNAKDTAAARLYLNRALNSQPDFVPALFLSGYLDYQTGNWAAAIKYLSHTVDLAPNYSDAKYFLGLSYRAAGRTNEAINQFQQLLKLNPGNQTIQDILNSWLKKS